MDASEVTANIADEPSKDKQDGIVITEKENNIQINTSNDIDMPLLENQEETSTIESTDTGTDTHKEPIATESSTLPSSLEIDLQTESSDTIEMDLQKESIDNVKTDSQDKSMIAMPNVEETDLQDESVKEQSNEEVDSQSNIVLSNTEESVEVVNNSDESFELREEGKEDSIENSEDITLEITETTENSENNTVDTSNEIEENACTINEVVQEEIPVKSSSDGYEHFAIDQENAIETENAIAHMISSEDPTTEAEADKMETQVVVENVEVANIPDEANTSNEEITEVQYHVVINEDNNGVSVNGMDQLNKDSLVLDTEPVVDSQTMENVVTISESNETQSTVDTVIALPSQTLTEVTLSDVQMLESHEGVMTVNELDEQSQVVILPSDQVILMEAEESYEQIESVDGSIVESEEEMKESKEDKVPKIEKNEEQTDDKSPVKIPCHVLGRSIDNPLVDPVRNGRVLLKPRLGVKIPYRNLTSQIVSKQEIAEEIMERSRLRQSAAEPPAGGDVFFAKKLTQRLAKKIVPGSKTTSRTTTKTTSASSSSSKKVMAVTEISKEAPKSQASPDVKKPLVPKELQESLRKSSTDALLKTPDTSGKIIDNSDLIALLEGDDIPDWNIGKNDTPLLPNQNKPDKQSADWEREIALKQLRNLPKQSKGTKHSYKQSTILQTSINSKETSTNNKEPTKDPQIEPKESKEIPQKNDIEEIQPRFSSSTPLKTYTRKRKPIDFIKPSSSLAALSPPKKPAISIDEKPSVQSPKKSAVNEEKSVVQSPKKPTPPNEEKSIVQAPKKPSASSEERKKATEEKSSQSTKKPTVTNEKSSSAQKTSSSAVQKSQTAQKVSSSSVQQKTPSVQKQPSTATVQKSSTVQKVATLVDQKSPAVQKSSTDQKSSAQKPPTDQKSPTVQKAKKSEEPSTPKVEPKVETPTPLTEKTQKSLSPNTYISKSSRIVKRKKIWDPDEVTPLPKFKSSKVTESTKNLEKSVNSEKKLNKSNSEKSDTPLAKPKLVSKSTATVLKPNNEKAPTKRAVVKKTIVKKKKPKRLTEVDRLLMDEGAVNLLYAVKNTEEIQNVKNKKKKTIISIDKAQRELMNKTNEIKNDLQINSTKDSPITLRKKDGSTPKSSPVKDVAATVLHRKKSKDSVSGSVHSPPASPGFAYSQHAEASRIIRRHSSSSFSSENSDGEFVTDKTNEKKQKAELQKKKSKVNHEKQGKALTVADKQVLSEEMSRNFNKASTDDPKYSQFETFSVRRLDNLVQIILAPTSPNGQMTLSAQVLKELAELLDILEKDKTCRVAVISSSGSSFCQGIDYKELASDDKTARQYLAEQYATCVRNFLTALTSFSKILVAGVHGNTVGLGVTMLPLFDMVFASDTATFSAPYARLGCAAEGGTLLTLPHIMHNALASELFLASRKLTAGEALRLGLVTRTLWPDKFQEELISALKVVSSQSLQSMQAIKKQLRHQLLENVEASLKSETSLLIQHWTSNECQSNFSSYSLEIK
ncbi:hypothetical protein ILUMI_25254 [Ignelater luminosus]|uniref:Uncharacterized protein n=1 Tax=Ignelater luminosus TaxID=2038154 RepID=A0A8K0C508_IGNLU|nr:hypothetical protein ILUMI_25254 [Ignelater luminosus]